MVTKATRRVSDILGDGKINFHEDLPREEIRNLAGKEITLLDARIMRGWHSQFGDSNRDWCLLQVDVKGVEFTTKCGGVVLVKRVDELIRRKALPILATITLEGDSERPYFNIT
jgi:hypothetical protein